MTKEEIVEKLLLEELRNRLFMKALEKLDFDSSRHSLDLSAPVFTLADFEKIDDDLRDWYLLRLEHYAAELEIFSSSIDILEQAKNFRLKIEEKRQEQ